jgi:hypothetical protein
MAKLTARSQLVLGTNITIDETARTFALIASATGSTTNGLIAKDGVALRAVYSYFIDLWQTVSYQDSPFPMYAIDPLSGQYQIGFDGQYYNSWKPADDATRNMLRDGGWEEWSSTSPLPAYTTTGVLNRVYAGIVALGAVNSGAQEYYQTTSSGAATNFTFTDSANIGVQVYGDSANGNFDTRTYFKAYVREQGYKYKDSVLADTGKSATGAYIVNVLLSNEQDFKIAANDAAMSGAPYSGITVTYFGTDQSQTIGSGSYPFRVVINGNGATLEQIYTKVQYLLRQNSDIDAGAGTVIGKTASLLLEFLGDTLYTKQGVYVSNVNSNDINRVVFTDQTSVQRSFPFTASGTLIPNAQLTGAGSYYRMFFTTLQGVLDDFGTSGAITVNDALGVPITGTFSSGSTTFSFDYDGNVQGGRTAGTDANVTVIAGRPGYAKPVQFGATLTRAKGINISLIAEQDRAYQP